MYDDLMEDALQREDCGRLSPALVNDRCGPCNAARGDAIDVHPVQAGARLAIGIEAVQRLIDVCRSGSFYEDHDASMDLLTDAQQALLGAADESVDLPGHKVYVFERSGSPWIEMVNDERPLVRMTVRLSPDDVRQIVHALTGAEPRAMPDGRGG